MHAIEMKQVLTRMADIWAEDALLRRSTSVEAWGT